MKNAFLRSQMNGCAVPTYVLPQDAKNSVTAGMLRFADIPGIRKPEVCEKGEETVYRFPSDGYCSLREAADRRIPGFGRKVLLGYCDAFLSAELFMLDPRAVVPDTDGIFWNVRAEAPELLCLPSRPRQETDFSPAEGLRQLCRFLAGDGAPLGDRICAAAVEGILQNGRPDWRRLRAAVEKMPRGEAGPALIRLSDGEIFSLRKGRNRIGRADGEAVLHVSDCPAVSRTHAFLEEKEGTWTVSDASLNHTFLNGKVLSKGAEEPLHAGDYLTLATEKFRFVA